MGNDGGILRAFLDSKAGVAFGKALGEKADELVEAFLSMQSAKEAVVSEPVTDKPNPPIPVTKEVET